MRRKDTSLLTVMIVLLLVCSVVPVSWSFKRGRSLDNPLCGEFKNMSKTRTHNRAGFGEAPFMIQLEYARVDTKQRLNCTGALLEEDKFITSVKCAKFYKDYKSNPDKYYVQARFGSTHNLHGQLKDIEAVEVNTFQTVKSHCGHEEVEHGLSLFTLNSKIELTLKGTKQNFVNTICHPDFFGHINEAKKQLAKKSLVLFNWMSDDYCAKYIPVKLTKCEPLPHDEKPVRENYFCINANGFEHDQFQEGSIVAYLDSNRWMIAGVLSKDADLYGGCELDHNIPPKVVLFDMITTRR